MRSAQLEDPAEREQLQAEENRLAHGVRLQEGVMTLLGRLVDGAERGPSALDHLAACEGELAAMQQLDPAMLNWRAVPAMLGPAAGSGPRSRSLRRLAGE